MLKLQAFYAALLASLTFSVQAAPNHDNRYDDARQACEQERNQGQRKKCLRELEASHPKAAQVAKAKCQDCAKVLGVRVEKRAGESNALGAVAGGAAGALLGNQVGSGSGKTIATIAGAVGGAYAGKKIQEKATERTVWIVDVQYDNGRRSALTLDHDPRLQRGDRVRTDGVAVSRY
jgi:outer membrane lipoprotein SlyB